MPYSNFNQITKTGKIVQMKSPEEALAASQKNGYIWLDYFEPTKSELEPLIELLGLHPLSIEDCFDDNQIPKVEDYPKHTFILFNTFHVINRELEIDEVDLFIGDHFLVTVSGTNTRGQNLAICSHANLEKDPENIRQGPAVLLHVLLDQIVDQKFAAIESLEEKLNEAEDHILADSAHFNPADLLNFRRELLELRKSLFHEREILVKIGRGDSPYIGGKVILLYRDIYDHLAKFFELTESSRDIVTSLMEMYLSMLNNQMAKSANDTNATVRRLTLITTIFMPLTLVAGIGGMSEYSMMTGSENWRVAYPLFLAGMVVLGVINYYFLQWFEKRRKKKAQALTEQNPLMR
jgi:magnesium transporter